MPIPMGNLKKIFSFLYLFAFVAACDSLFDGFSGGFFARGVRAMTLIRYCINVSI
jgi:hypothetical protein